ncbi:MAG: 50S ribosomal protein L15 [Candidatus Wildermuthbacteria bacterium]|nr:50S ribosomal protein L15 [Candidatus Wildermuthbacteria bacterium]
MQLHELKPQYPAKKRKRVGRGGKRGTYSGKGMKGQNSRTGTQFKPIIRELIKRYPKMRGYRFKSIRPLVQPVNVSDLNSAFKADEKVTPAALAEKGIIRILKSKAIAVKVLGGGALDKSLTIEGCAVSKSAKEKIEKAGGKVMI